MKKLFLATAAVAALISAPALAQNVGSVGVNYTNVDVDAAGDSDIWSVDGVVAMPAFGSWTVTVEGALVETDGVIPDRTTLSGAVHLTTLVRPDIRVGGFVAANDAVTDQALTIGAEAAKYFSNVTLSGSLSYTEVDQLDIDAWTAGAEAAWYVRPNVRLAANVAGGDLSVPGDSETVWTYGVSGEYQFATSPVSLTAAYSRSEIADIDVDTYSLGLRYNFGGSIQYRDRAGAYLNGASAVTTLLGMF